MVEFEEESKIRVFFLLSSGRIEGERKVFYLPALVVFVFIQTENMMITAVAIVRQAAAVA